MLAFLKEWSPSSLAKAAVQVDAENVLSEAFAAAKSNRKNLVVHIGSPGCGWCRVLEAFLKDHATLFDDDYVVVKIDEEEMEHSADVA